MRRTIKFPAPFTVLAMILVCLVACDGNPGGPAPSRTTDLDFVVKTFAHVGQRDEPIGGVEVYGKFGTAQGPPSQAADPVKGYDWSAQIPQSSNWANVTGYQNQPVPQYMSVYMTNNTMCITNPTVTNTYWEKRGADVPVKCASSSLATAQPSVIDVTSVPPSITITGDDLANQYGTPRLQWVDAFGTVVADQYATSYNPDGTSVTLVPPSNIGGLYSGTYIIIVLAVQSDGTYWSQGAAQMNLVGNDPPPFNPAPCGFATWEDYQAAQQCRVNEVWDDSMCACRPLMID